MGDTAGGLADGDGMADADNTALDDDADEGAAALGSSLSEVEAAVGETATLAP